MVRMTIVLQSGSIAVDTITGGSTSPENSFAVPCKVKDRTHTHNSNT